MTHWRAGIMSGRASLRGVSTDTSAFSANTRADRLDEIFGHRQIPSIQSAKFPPAWPNSRGSNPALFIPVTPALKRGKFAQTCIDVSLVIVGAVIGSVVPTAIGLLGYVLYLKFVVHA